MNRMQKSLKRKKKEKLPRPFNDLVQSHTLSNCCQFCWHIFSIMYVPYSVSLVMEFLRWFFLRPQNFSFLIPVKGQLISKCPFGVIVWTKIPTKSLTNLCLRIWNHKIKALYNVFNTLKSPYNLLCNYSMYIQGHPGQSVIK